MKKTLRNIIKEAIKEEVSPKDIVERLSKAVSLKEWGLVEDVLRDLLEEGWQYQWSLDTLTMSAEEKDEIERWRDRKR